MLHTISREASSSISCELNEIKHNCLYVCVVEKAVRFWGQQHEKSTSSLFPISPHYSWTYFTNVFGVFLFLSLSPFAYIRTVIASVLVYYKLEKKKSYKNLGSVQGRYTLSNLFSFCFSSCHILHILCADLSATLIRLEIFCFFFLFHKFEHVRFLSFVSGFTKFSFLIACRLFWSSSSEVNNSRV